MNSDGSLQGGLFDLGTQAGIMHLLASVRASDLPSDKKHELRDIIFLYTNGGRDQSVKLSIEQKITAYKVAPVVGGPKSTAAATAPEFTIGGSRPAPDQFVSRPVASVAQTVPVIPPPPVTPTAVPIAPPPPPAPTPPPPPAPTPPPPPVTLAPVPDPVTTEMPIAPIAPGDSVKYLERIREIKALVNQRIGNPVNLVDINAEVGREYMGALLDAMKKINSGASAIAAMKRLEETYLSVQKVLDTHETAPISVSAPAPAPAPVSIPNVAPPVIAVPVPQPLPTPSTPPPPPPPAPPIPVASPIATPRPIVVTPPTTPSPVSIRPATGALPVSEVNTPTPAQSVASKESGFSTTKLSALTSAPLSQARKPVGTESTDPLHSPEVDKGLDQLLSEWSLFKKSGMFGSGPKGREHPLFKKIAGLQIPLLLAGRFEGATQEIKQSITDYMNGWRYEQGIIYMQGETFERYLRRVIKHILDLQNKATRS